MKKIFSFLLLLVALHGSAQHWNYTPGTFLAPGGLMPTAILTPPADTIHSAPVGSLACLHDTVIYIRNLHRWQVFSGSAGATGSGIGAVYAGLYLTQVNDSTLKADSAAMAAYFVRRKDSVAGGYYPYSTNPKSYLTTISGIAAGGDLSGTYPNPTVTWANGYTTYDTRYLTSTSKNQLLSGGKVVWLHDYVYNVSAATYLIDGVQYSTASTDITLSAADATNDRIDLFVLTTSSTAIAVTGTPSTPPVAPDFDANTQLKISFATVAASTTEPTITNEWIYKENTEWTTSASAGTIAVASTNNPYAGTKDVEGTNVANGTYVSFTSVTTLTIGNYENLIFEIRSKANWGTAKKWIIRFYNGTTAVGNPVNFGSSSYGFVSSATSQYQNITIPLSDFGSISTATAVRITQSNTTGTVGWYLDNIQLQGGQGGGTPQTITIVGDASGSGSNTINTTVSGLRNKVLPALSAGKLIYTGSAFAFDNTTYLSGTVGIANGGTNITTYTTGDILYASATNVLSKLPIGTARQTLHVVGGVPVWIDTTAAGSGGISALAAIGSSPNANGATISGSTLNLEPANGSFGGVVTTAAQTFAGNKTLSGTSIFAPNIGSGATTDELVLWNSTDGFRHLTPGSYAKMILNQYASQQTASAWIDSIKAKERIISDQYYVGSARYSVITPAMLFDSTQSKRGLYMMGDDKQAGTYNRYFNMYWDATDTTLFHMDITAKLGASFNSKKLIISDRSTGGNGAITLDAGLVTLGRSGGNQVTTAAAFNAQSDITCGGGLYYAASDAAPAITQLRGSSNTAGKDLTIKAGPSQTGAATNLNAGNLILSTDISEGTGVGHVKIYSTPSGGGGDNSPTQKVQIFGTAGVLIQDGGTFTQTASALLEVNSTTQGLLLPRMTKTQRDAISSPVAGLAIYQTDNTPGLRVYNGTNWIKYTETTD